MLKVRTPSNNMENVTAIKSGNIKGVKSCAVLTLLPLIMTCMLFVDIFSIDLTHFYQLCLKTANAEFITSNALA